MIRRILPHPPLSVLLLLLWLLLNQSLSPGQLILGTVFAIVGPWLLVTLDVPTMTVRRPRAILQLIGVVFVELVRSNIAVAKVIFGRSHRRTSGFARVPLDMRSPYGLAMLAVILTATPGTIWVNFNPSSGVIVLHVLDLIDDQDWAKIVKQRYERLLMEIFE